VGHIWWGRPVGLTKADLSGATLWEQPELCCVGELSGTNLNEANLSEANLSGANLSGAKLSRPPESDKSDRGKPAQGKSG